MMAGLCYLLTGIFAACVVALFVAFPRDIVMALAGLALMSTLAKSMSSALTEPQTRESALLSFLVTASGVSLWGLGSAFWGSGHWPCCLLFTPLSAATALGLQDATTDYYW